MTMAERIAAALGKEVETVADLGIQRVVADDRDGSVTFTFDENGEDCVALIFARDITGNPFYVTKMRIRDEQNAFMVFCAFYGIEIKNPIYWEAQR